MSFVVVVKRPLINSASFLRLGEAFRMLISRLKTIEQAVSGSMLILRFSVLRSTAYSKALPFCCGPLSAVSFPSCSFRTRQCTQSSIDTCLEGQRTPEELLGSAMAAAGCGGATPSPVPGACGTSCAIRATCALSAAQEDNPAAMVQALGTPGSRARHKCLARIVAMKRRRARGTACCFPKPASRNPQGCYLFHYTSVSKSSVYTESPIVAVADVVCFNKPCQLHCIEQTSGTASLGGGSRNPSPRLRDALPSKIW